MVPDKLDKKYRPFIWLGLLFASYVRNIYSIIYSALIFKADIAAGSTNLTLTLDALDIIFSYGVIPMLVCYLAAQLVHRFATMRYGSSISRRDFCYYVMAVTSVSRLFMGLIEVFGILDSRLISFTAPMLSTTVNPAAMLIMFFVIFKRKYPMNPVERYNAYRPWTTMFMAVGGLSAVVSNSALLIMRDTPEFANLLLTQYGINILDKYTMAGCITGIAVYFAYLVVMIVLGERLRKRAASFRNPETRADYYATHGNEPYKFRDDSYDVFGDDGSDTDRPHGSDGKDDNVFDEFDL